MPILKGTGNTLLCSRFGYAEQISTRAKSVNSENRHLHGSTGQDRLKGCGKTDYKKIGQQRFFSVDKCPNG